MLYFAKFRRFHLVGIGGAGTAGLAEILLRAGFSVSGSDLQDGHVLAYLRRLGGQIYVGHKPSQIGDAQAVVYSSAVPASNPELRAARRRGVPTIPRGLLLAEMMRFKESIAIAGSHGKTTTTALIAVMLRNAGMDPTALVGARSPDLGSSARLGQGRTFVAEADESDRSFLYLSPLHAVVTNIDTDHMDQYADLAELAATFRSFVERLPFYGTLVACVDDPNVASVVKNVHLQVITYGLQGGAEWTADDIRPSSFGTGFLCVRREEPLGRVQLRLCGNHNVQNALAAVAVGHVFDLPFATISHTLQKFQGTERRLQRKGDRNGVQVFDDYGHHPTEIRATLAACRNLNRRLVVVFQPHRYSRTLHLMEDLATSFEDADLLYLVDVYPAGEKILEGAASGNLAERIAERREVRYFADWEEVIERLNRDTREGDLILTLGAGDVWKIGERYLEEEKR